jgi:hypothetical protein
MEKSLALLFLIQLFICSSLKLIPILIISNIRKKNIYKTKNEINNLIAFEGRGGAKDFVITVLRP